MNYAYEIRRQAEAAPRAALPAVTAALWKAFGEGRLSEIEAEALSGLIEARLVLRKSEDCAAAATNAEIPGIADVPTAPPRSRAGSRPRTDASMARRRRWAASGRLPPALAARFTLAEQAVLAVVAVEVAKRGSCSLAVGNIAALAGVSETSVRNALREARTIDLVTIEERRLYRYRNDTNLVRIVSAEWAAWLRLARKDGPSPSGRGGCKSPQSTNTPVSYPVNSEGRRSRKGIRGAESGIAVAVYPCRTAHRA